MVSLPPTTEFPPDPEPLSREELNNTYLKLRNSYKSAIRSRGQHRSLANRAREETTLLKQRLLELAAREASVRTDIYQILEIVTTIAGDLEDAGEDLVSEFGHYKLGRKSYQGGSSLARLVQAVIRFINRWTHTKERVVQLDQKRLEFIEKTRDLVPLPVGGDGSTGTDSHPNPSPPAKLALMKKGEQRNSMDVPNMQEGTGDGPTH